MSEHAINGSVGPVIPASAETLLRFQPGRADGEEEHAGEPVYLLAAPTEKLKRAYQAALTARGFKYPSDAELMSEIRVWLDDMREVHEQDPEQGITEATFDRRMTDLERFHERQVQVLEDARRKIKALSEAAKDGADDAAVTAITSEKLSRTDQLVVDRYQQLRRLASEHCPGVQAMEQQRVRYVEAYQQVAAAVALRGWEGREGDVIVHGTEASAATMAQLDEDTQTQIGAHWREQSMLTEAQKKTSVLPPPSPTIPTTTPEAGSSRPSSTDAVADSPRSRATKSGTKSTTPTRVT